MPDFDHFLSNATAHDPAIQRLVDEERRPDTPYPVDDEMELGSGRVSLPRVEEESDGSSDSSGEARDFVAVEYAQAPTVETISTRGPIHRRHDGNFTLWGRRDVIALTSSGHSPLRVPISSYSHLPPVFIGYLNRYITVPEVVAYSVWGNHWRTCLLPRGALGMETIGISQDYLAIGGHFPITVRCYAADGICFTCADDCPACQMVDDFESYSSNSAELYAAVCSRCGYGGYRS